MRTNDHVFRSVLDLLLTTDIMPITYAAIATQCEVSRRTLYTHWATLPEFWNDMFMHFYLPMSGAVTLPTVEGRMEQGLLHIRDWLSTPVGRAALLAPDETGATRRGIIEMWRAELSTTVVRVDDHTFSRLVGPLCFDALFLGERTLDAAVRDLARLTLISDILTRASDLDVDEPEPQ